MTIGVSLLLLAACQTETKTNQPLQDCEANGGKIMNARIGEVCSMPASDAAKNCTDNAECEGLCMSHGQCSPYKSNFGCHDILDNGKTVTICID